MARGVMKDETVIDRFFDRFADLDPAQRQGVITGLQATHRAMLRRVDAPAAQTGPLFVYDAAELLDPEPQEARERLENMEIR